MLADSRVVVVETKDGSEQKKLWVGSCGNPGISTLESFDARTRIYAHLAGNNNNSIIVRLYV